MRDNESWLIPFWGQQDWPLLFDENYSYKIAHKGFIEGTQ
jgi:endo-1,4-beta-xylanase